MVSSVGSISIDLSTTAVKFSEGFKRSATTVERESARMAKSVSGIETSLKTASFAAKGLISGALVHQVVQYADAWTVAGNKIRAAGEIAGVQVRTLEDLTTMASANRTSLESTVDLYSKLITATKGVAKSEQEVANATEIITRAFKAGGAATSEQTAGILQLSQALASGVLQGDELRSIRENAPLIAKAIADEFKTTIGGLKALGASGALTSDRVFNAVLKAKDSIDKGFKATTATIGESFQILSNSVGLFIGKLDAATGASGLLAQAIQHIATGIDKLPETVPNLGDKMLGDLKGAKDSGEVINRVLGEAGAKFNELNSVATRSLAEINAELIETQKYANELIDRGLREGWDTVRLEIGLTAEKMEALKQEIIATGSAAAETMKRAALASQFRAAEIKSMADLAATGYGKLPTVSYGGKTPEETAAIRAKEAAEEAKRQEALQKETTEAIREAPYITGRYVDEFHRDTAGYFDRLGSTLSGDLQGLSASITRMAEAGLGYTADRGFKFSGIGGSGSWAGRRYTSGGGTSDFGEMYGMPVSSAVTDASQITPSGGAQPISVSVVVKPVMEGTRLSTQSSAEIKQAAAAGTNAALRSYYGR